jgi:hypothetical protein
MTITIRNSIKKSDYVAVNESNFDKIDNFGIVSSVITNEFSLVEITQIIQIDVIKD